MRNARPTWKPKRKKHVLAFVHEAPALTLGLLVVAAAGYSTVSNAVGAVSANSDACDIKGNISIASHERIYHVPGQAYYADTKISPRYGERWFCSESEARAAGWRKSKV